MVKAILPDLIVSNARHADRILSNVAGIRSTDLEVTEEEGGMLFFSTLDKSPPPTFCVDPPETLELLSLQGQSVQGMKKNRTIYAQL